MVHLEVNFRRCVIIAELWRPQVARPQNFVSNFCVFKTTPYGKMFKILFRKFSPPHLSTLLCSAVVKFVPLEIGEIVLTEKKTKFRLFLKLSLLLWSSAQQIRSLSAEL